jgi:hypothetical protein
VIRRPRLVRSGVGDIDAALIVDKSRAGGFVAGPATGRPSGVGAVDSVAAALACAADFR